MWELMGKAKVTSQKMMEWSQLPMAEATGKMMAMGGLDRDQANRLFLLLQPK